MPEILEVSAIAQQVKARIKQIEDQLMHQQKLTDELERLRDALSRLEGEARSRASSARTRAAKAASSATSPARAPRGQNKAKVLDALTDGPMTASEIAKVTGIGTRTVSTLLNKMARSGELAKAERGYMLPQ